MREARWRSSMALRGSSADAAAPSRERSRSPRVGDRMRLPQMDSLITDVCAVLEAYDTDLAVEVREALIPSLPRRAAASCAALSMRGDQLDSLVLDVCAVLESYDTQFAVKVREALIPCLPHRAAASPRPRLFAGVSVVHEQEWSGHFDGRVRPFRLGYAFGVADARVDRGSRYRSVFASAYEGNSLMIGPRILAVCAQLHLDGACWGRVMHLVLALHEVARRESESPPGALIEPFEEWSGHFDGVTRPCHQGFVLGVEDALVDSGSRRRSVFVDAFDGNDLLPGPRILAWCAWRHREGARWERVIDLADALRRVARDERRFAVRDERRFAILAEAHRQAREARHSG